MSIKHQCLGTNTITKTPYKVEQWGVNVLIREWTPLERSKFIEWQSENSKKPGESDKVYGLLLCISCEFEDGSKFEESDIDAILSQQSVNMLDGLVEKILEVN